ncbi:MAG TPA: formylglycine-generating enzyme family protein [Candidatus Latescibacteria bacterium]|jgi:formylglycine-generating enzyme required for sulfatase activity|nr:formylglycine-generating enzyme family protein [Candidatus Latescibacterota bacterium]HJP29821.1 formylglycine-generating enzyme family protein [Candidatus Latescibacterota bacterium]
MARRQLFATFTGLLISIASMADSARAETDPPHLEEAEFALPGGQTMRFVWIEAGSFLMGSAEDEELVISFEFPRHEVTIEHGFYLGQFEITQAQWTAVMGTEPWTQDSRTYVSDDPSHPATYVSWLDVQDFVSALNDAEGGPYCRLPTEAEWEYAGRAGTTTRWSWGDDPDLIGDYAWNRDNTFFRGEPWAHPVGQKLPNPWKLYDMHGNAWEWVQDWSGVYAAGPQVDPQGPEDGQFRIVRGGIFMGDARGLRSAFRYGGSQDFPDGGVGARLVRQAPSSPATSVRASTWGSVKGRW